MNYWIDIEDAGGNRLGDGPILSASEWESTTILDQAGTFRFSMPASDPRAALIQPKRIARCYARVQDNVTEIGSGIIDQRQYQLDAQGRTNLTVSGSDLLLELANRSVGFLALTDGAGGGTPEALGVIGALMAECGWSFDEANGYGSTLGNVYAQFSGESILAALVKIAEGKGEHFRLSPGRKVSWLRKDLRSSGIRAVQGGDPQALEGNPDACIILSLEEVRDSYEVVSRLYPFGSGIADARLTLAGTNRTAPNGYVLDKPGNYLKRSATEATYGRIDRYISFKEISPVSNTDADLQNAANALFDAALEYMEKHKQPEQFYTIKVAKVERLLKPGETLRVVYRQVGDGYTLAEIDRDLFILEVVNRIDRSGIRTTEVKVATVDRPQETDEAALVSRMEEVRVMESYPQLNANAYYENFYDAIDGSNDLEFPILLGREVVNINEVTLYFKPQRLESTVKSVAGQSSTSSNGGGGTVTSAAGGSGSTSASGGAVGATSEGGSAYHSHGIPVNAGDNGSPVYLQGGRLYSFGGGTPATTYADITHTHRVNVPAHSHTVSLPAHSHQVSLPAHTHTLTPTVSMVYGIYRDNAANVPALSELTITVNGVEVPALESEIGSGWYEADLTGLVSDPATFRPLRTVNTLRIACAAGKRAHISGKVRVRSVIQAIAVL